MSKEKDSDKLINPFDNTKFSEEIALVIITYAAFYDFSKQVAKILAQQQTKIETLTTRVQSLEGIISTQQKMIASLMEKVQLQDTPENADELQFKP